MLRFILLLTLLAPTMASAQVRLGVRFGWTAPPPVVEINPGVQIVEDGDQEVFFSGGYYWVERDGGWYRANDWHENWQPVRGRRVPIFIRNHQRGSFAHWRGADHPNGWRGQERGHDDRERREGHVGNAGPEREEHGRGHDERGHDERGHDDRGHDKHEEHGH